MSKIKLNRKIVITASYVVAILFAIVFAIYPKTNSVFIKTNDKSLVYKSNLIGSTLGDKDLGLALNEADSDINTAKFTLILIRDHRYKDENEYYMIEGFSSLAKETVVCSVDKKSKSPNLDIVEETIDEKTVYKISFNKKSLTNPEQGSIDIECDVRKNMAQKEDIDVLVKVYEAIGEEDRFVYQSKTLVPKIAYQDYKQKYSPADPNRTIYFEKDGKELTDEEVYDAFLRIMKDHYVDINDFAKTYNVPMRYFENYINDYGTLDPNDKGVLRENAREMLLGDNFKSLLGITRSAMRDSEGTNIIGYSFDFDENLTGYVKSYNLYKLTPDDLNRGKRIYFSALEGDNKSKNIERALKETLSNYIYTDTDIIKIGEKDYTKVDLMYEYINEYIVKNKGGVYSLENLAGMEEIIYRTAEELVGASDTYPYVSIDYITLDVAYNHFSKESGIRVSHYTDKLDITYVFEEAIKIYDTALQKALKGSTNLSKAVTCTSSCSSYTEKFIVGSYTYTVKVEPNTGYNFITIDKVLTPIEENIKVNFDTATNMVADFNTKIDTLTTTSKYKDVKTIMKNNISDINSNFYKAITSKTSTANDTEIYYANGNIYSITVKHNSTNNEIIVNKESTLKTAITKIYSGTLPSSLQAAINNTTSTLANDIKCTTSTCTSYNDIYYDGTDYSAIKVTHNVSDKYNKVEVILNSNFKTMMGNMYNTSVTNSLDSSYRTRNYIYNALLSKTGANYLEIHYDSTKNEYLLFKVEHSDSANIISSSVLMSNASNKTTEMTKTMTLLKEEYNNNGTYCVYLHTKYYEDGTDDKIIYFSKLQEYLEKHLIIDLNSTNTSDTEYTRVDFYIDDIN